jgi:ABC-type polar amino acid transport system ATPase subunit
MQQLVDDGMTMLTVTHEMGFARESADRIMIMDEGNFVEIGPPAQIFDDPQDERTKAFLSAFARLEGRED